MSRAAFIAQPTTRTTLDALQGIVQDGQIQTIDVAVAYITSGGAYDLLNRMSQTLGADWENVPKRWITAFDYCRSEPVALDSLVNLPNSSVRIHSPKCCLKHGGTPERPFHPKTFLVQTHLRDYVLAGSGNMSRSGLSRGFEAGLVVGIDRVGSAEPTASETIQCMRTWFSTIWHSAKPLTPALLKSYQKIFEHKDNLKAPAPTEDDIASTDNRHGSLSSRDLQKLRVCRHLWIQAGNITKNRGTKQPGNQLMMKRLSRVFFGFSSTTVAENTHIGDVTIMFNNGQGHSCSLTYSDNKMDKLGLPIPGSGGPPAYDRKYLLFRTIKPGVFELTIGTGSMKRQWLKRSRAIGAAYRMASGREWGVF